MTVNFFLFYSAVIICRLTLNTIKFYTFISWCHIHLFWQRLIPTCKKYLKIKVKSSNILIRPSRINTKNKKPIFYTLFQKVIQFKSKNEFKTFGVQSSCKYNMKVGRGVTILAQVAVTGKHVSVMIISDVRYKPTSVYEPEILTTLISKGMQCALTADKTFPLSHFYILKSLLFCFRKKRRTDVFYTFNLNYICLVSNTEIFKNKENKMR